MENYSPHKNCGSRYRTRPGSSPWVYWRPFLQPKAASDALTKVQGAAIGFAKEHPAYATLIALGILAVLMPWALEILGFGELGPIEGSFAAAWQRTYADYVPKDPLFSYSQWLGMKWHWVV